MEGFKNTNPPNSLPSGEVGDVKISGFTIVRNAIKYDYPIVEAITSILPLCDEVIVAVGASEDETLELIRSIASPKIKIIETVWDDTLREGGKVLADETNKAFAAVSKESDWAFYIQGDEVIHEKYLPVIKQAMEKFKVDKNVEGLLFNYTHFYGSYDYIGDSRHWYRREIRVIRNDKSISSYLDAQGFRKNGKKLKVQHIDASVYHYGWVKPPETQQAKQQTFNKLWHDDAWMKKNVANVDKFDYSQTDSVAIFRGTHPQVMQSRIHKMNWKFSFDPTKKKLSLKVKLLMLIEKYTGWKIGEYKNYKIV
ncbi:MAG: glycosyltransferase family 2 protein [Bacteroidetes bacterium]|nr:glycosyltransferase family 2 protein [Bacteroidota bacterium]